LGVILIINNSLILMGVPSTWQKVVIGAIVLLASGVFSRRSSVRIEVFFSSVWNHDCTLGGACCAAPDISSLNKPLGVPCVHLGSIGECAIYETPPHACRNDAPDWVCAEVAPLPRLEDRTTRFLEIYGLEIP
jgi:uncharacterized protein